MISMNGCVVSEWNELKRYLKAQRPMVSCPVNKVTTVVTHKGQSREMIGGLERLASMVFPGHEHLRYNVAHHRLHLLDGDGSECRDEDSVRQCPVVLGAPCCEQAISREGADFL